MRPPLQRSIFVNGCILVGLLLAGCTGRVEGGSKPPAGGPAATGAPVGPGSTGTGNSGALPGTGSVPGITTGAGGGGSGMNVVAPGTGSGTGTAVSCDGLTSRRLRRLSIEEYSNVVSSFLGAPAGATALTTLPQDVAVDGFDAGSLYVSPSLHDAIADLAATLASQVSPTTLAPCATATGSPTCLQTFIRSLATKAYGRPIADDEFTRLNTMASAGEDYATQVRLVVEFMLQSPGLLYVTEMGSPTTPVASGKAVPLTQYEVASQLSFLLTSSRPDDTLLKAAETTGLAKPTDIVSQAQRLLTTDPRAKVALTRFINGWMNMGPLSDFPKDPDMFPAITPAVLTAMQQEYDQFVTTQLNGGDGTVSSFFMASTTNVPKALAPIYGADLLATGVDPNRRRGFLSLPAVLSVHSGYDHSGPVERGLLVRRQLLCQYIPGPPQDALDKIALNPIDATDPSMTTRQKLDAHLNEPSCQACHVSFDPIGFGFEQMDGIGRFRTTENGKTVDSTGMLTATAAVDGSSVDGPFVGPAQLSGMLAQSKLVEVCMTEHFFDFAQARLSVAGDKCVISNWAAKFSQGGGHIKDLVLTAVADPNFVNRKDDR